MKGATWMGCGMVAALVVGCAASPLNPILEEQLRLIDEMTAILNEVTDKRSYDDAQLRLKELKRRGRDLEAKLEKQVKTLSEEETEAAVKKYKGLREEATVRFFEAQKQAMEKAGLVSPTAPMP
jgi:hypothetical protein